MSLPVQFFLLTFMFLFIQGFFSMMEMACVSFNRVRLQYYVSQNNQRAKWISELICNPSKLFGTTLVGVNAALQFGSECSRRFYESIGLSPDWAPITQIILVVVFAELAPMFAARRYAEHVMMLGIHILYFFSIILRPLHIFFDLINKLLSYFGKNKGESMNYLTREELQKAMEQREDLFGYSETKEFDTLAANIFSLKNMTAKEIMYPIRDIFMLPSDATAKDMQKAIRIRSRPFIPVYHLNTSNIIGIVYSRDMIKAKENDVVKDYIKSPWFITESNSLPQIIKQFRWNKQNVAVVLSKNGVASGLLALDAIIEEIFLDTTFTIHDLSNERTLIDRSFPSDTEISEINQHFNISIGSNDPDQTLEDLMIERLGHHPSKGESIRAGHYELTVEEAPLIGDKVIHIKSI